MRKILLGAAASAVVLAPAMASAEEGKWYLNPALGYQVTDSDFDTDDSAMLVLGLENKLSKDWGVELGGTISAGGDDELSSVTLSLLRYFNSGNDKLEPFAALGIGAAGVEYDKALDEEDYYTQVNVGGGARYKVNDSLNVRGGASYLYGVDGGTGDLLVTLGLSFDLAALGSGSTAAPAPAPAPAMNDMDADGVEDGMDQCSGTPAGIAVDAKGCPLDKDGDGVPNYRDKCPNTPEGRQVDKFGCKFVLTSSESIKMEISFASNSDVIPAAYRSELEKVAAFMKQYSGVRAVIEGHSDSMGAAAYNKTLSQRRADAVRKALVEEYGIASNRLSAVGYGEERPIASNDTAAGRKANRRVVAVMEAEVVQ